MLREWSLAALRAYDTTFPQTNPLKWGLTEGDCSWEAFRLPGACDCENDRDSDSSPERNADKNSETDKDSNADGDVNDELDGSDDDDNGKHGSTADGDEDLEG